MTIKQPRLYTFVWQRRVPFTVKLGALLKFDKNKIAEWLEDDRIEKDADIQNLKLKVRKERGNMARNTEKDQKQPRKRLLNIEETSEYLGIAKGTLYQWISQRKIPYVKLGRKVLFDLKELDDMIEKSRVEVFDWEKAI